MSLPLRLYTHTDSHLVFHVVIYDLPLMCRVLLLYVQYTDHEILKTYKIFIIKYVSVLLLLQFSEKCIEMDMIGFWPTNVCVCLAVHYVTLLSVNA